MKNYPFVSIIIPCRNEADFIDKCLDSLIANDYPKDRMEILVIDGLSEDRTKEIIDIYANKYPFIKRIENPKKITPVAWNIGIKNSKGEIISMLGSHSTYSKNYISKSVQYLSDYHADVAGGVLRAAPARNTLVAKAIAYTVSHPFGSGLSYKGGLNKVKWVDTVFAGSYRKEILEKTGLFNENLVRSQDMDFNIRLKKAGGKILLVPEIGITYYPKSTFREFLKHNFKDGIWAILPLKFGATLFKPRHLIPLIFVTSIVIALCLSIFISYFLYIFLFIAGLYLTVSFTSSIHISIKHRNFIYLFLALIAFAIRHFAYGIGSLWGILKLIF